MAQLVPVDNDPFAAPAVQNAAPVAAQPTLVPVDNDPFSPMKHVPIVSAKSGVIGYRDVPESELNQSTGSKVLQAADDALRNTANGLTLGASDKAAALGEALTGGGSYSDNLSKERALSADAVARNPGIAQVNQAGGMLATGLGLGRAGVTLAPLMEGAPLIGRMGLGAAEGAGYGAANELGHNDAEMGWQKVKAALNGAEMGAKFGAALPLAGSLAGKAFEWASPFFSSAATGLSPRASGILTNAATADARGMQNLPQLGPQAMPADAGPSMTGLAQGAAMAPGDARSAIVDALSTRNAARNARLGEDLTQNLGPYQDPILTTQSVKQARSALTGPMYTKAFAEAAPVDAAPVMTAIDKRLETAEGAEKAALQKIKGMLVEAPATAAVAPQRVPVTTPSGGVIYHTVGGQASQPQQVENMAERLHNIKGEIDSLINYGDPQLGIPPGSLSREQGALVQLRKTLNNTLETQVPGYAAANAKSAEYARMGDSIETGFNALKKGDEAVSPALFENLQANATPAELGGIQIGTRARLENAVGTQSNDLAALRSTVGEPQDWNAQKLGQIYSPEQAQAVSDALNREQTFATTFNDVARGSQTAPRLAAQKQLADRGEIRIPPIMEWPTAAASAGSRAVLKAILNRSSEGVRNEVAGALTSTGSARDELVRALLSASVGRGLTRANIRDAIGNPALIRSLALSQASSGP